MRFTLPRASRAFFLPPMVVDHTLKMPPWPWASALPIVIGPGSALNQFRIEALVGQGGMAMVYRAADTSLGRPVAIKVLHPHLAISDEARGRFAREAQAIAKLRHEHIVEIYEYGAHDSNNYIVTEFIDGQTLTQFQKAHPVRVPELGCAIALPIARALCHAHAAGILHRDVKPDNVMLRADGTVKLMDFGIARILDHVRMTVTGQLLGSPAYMAPEVIDGSRVGLAADIYSFGVMLYELVTGQRAFDGTSAHEVLLKVAEGRIEPPCDVNARVPRAVGQIVERCMARNPADRYGDMNAVLTDLETFLREHQIDASKPALARLLSEPDAYQETTEQDLIRLLLQQSQSAEPVQALAAVGRILAIDPAHREAQARLATLHSGGRRRRVAWGALGLGAVVVAGWGLAQVPWQLYIPGAGARAANSVSSAAGPNAINAPAADARVESTDRTVALAASATATPDAPTPGGVAPARRALPKVEVRPTAQTIQLNVWPVGSEVQIAGGAWQRPSDGNLVVTAAGPTRVAVRNEACCLEESRVLKPGDERATIRLAFAPAQLTLRCSRNVPARVDGRTVRLGQPVPILFGDSTQPQRRVKVEFIGTTVETTSALVKAGQTSELTCEARQ